MYVQFKIAILAAFLYGCSGPKELPIIECACPEKFYIPKERVSEVKCIEVSDTKVATYKLMEEFPAAVFFGQMHFYMTQLGWRFTGEDSSGVVDVRSYGSFIQTRESKGEARFSYNVWEKSGERRVAVTVAYSDSKEAFVHIREK